MRVLSNLSNIDWFMSLNMTLGKDQRVNVSVDGEKTKINRTFLNITSPYINYF